MHANLRSWIGLGVGLTVAGIALGIGNFGRLVYLMDVHPGVAGWVQAFGSIAAIIVSVAAAVLLQDRDRAKRRAEDRSIQLVAIHAIASNALATCERVNEKALASDFKRSIIKRLADEARMAEDAVSAINLTQVHFAEIIRQLARIQRNLGSVRRRLGYALDKTYAPGEPITEFSAPLKEVRKAASIIEKSMMAHSTD